MSIDVDKLVDVGVSIEVEEPEESIGWLSDALTRNLDMDWEKVCSPLLLTTKSVLSEWPTSIDDEDGVHTYEILLEGFNEGAFWALYECYKNDAGFDEFIEEMDGSGS